MFRVVTIGGYGFDEATFLQVLRREEVDTFVDIRQRRGMRGARYAFLNSRRLQELLAGAGVRYLHAKWLAPPREIRELQKEDDRRTGQAKRSRAELSPRFIEAYRKTILSARDPQEFVDLVGPDATTVALFCVEREPRACHRSIVADWLAVRLGVRVRHLMP